MVGAVDVVVFGTFTALVVEVDDDDEDDDEDEDGDGAAGPMVVDDEATSGSGSLGSPGWRAPAWTSSGRWPEPVPCVTRNTAPPPRKATGASATTSQRRLRRFTSRL